MKESEKRPEADTRKEVARARTEEVKADVKSLWCKLLLLYEDGVHADLGYPSWHAYCKAEFELGRSSAYRLLNAGRVSEAVIRQSPIGDSPPKESQARELARLDDEQLSRAVDEIRGLGGFSKVTAKTVRSIVRTLLGKGEPPQPGLPDLRRVMRRARAISPSQLEADLSESDGDPYLLQELEEVAGTLVGFMVQVRMRETGQGLQAAASDMDVAHWLATSVKHYEQRREEWARLGYLTDASGARSLPREAGEGAGETQFPPAASPASAGPLAGIAPPTKLWASWRSWAPSWAHPSLSSPEEGRAHVWLLDPRDGQSGAPSTLNVSPCPNDPTESSLSDVLVARCHRRFYLSPRAARGIVKRAAKRGKELPPELKRSLDALAEQAPEES